jgi:oxygen-dependent protoporphyrinogen oxidase
MKEPFVKQSGKEESVSEFFKRRLGDEFFDYAVDPFVTGKFAGKPERLSVRSTFHNLCELEEKYKGLFKGIMIHGQERKKYTKRVKKFSFKHGMQTLPIAIAGSLGRSIILNAKVTGVFDQAMTGGEPMNEPDARRYLVEYLQKGTAKKIEADFVVFAIPAYDAAPIVKSLSAEAAHTLSSIYYSPIVSVFIGAKLEDFGHPPNGFGFLVPSKEKRQILGCIWNSSLFSDRAPSGMVALNVFVGGARQPELTDLSDDRIAQIILEELKSIMQFSGKPVYLRLIRWKKAIPQYEIGHQQKIDALTRFEEAQPGIVLAGNYRNGISMDDCVRNGYEIAEALFKKNISTR